MVTIPLTVRVNGEKKTVGSARIETPERAYSPVTVTATVNDVEFAKVIQGPLTGLSISAQPTETHSDNTLYKVSQALHQAGMNGAQIERAINEMQNHGILFRERA
jgi:hypothetical protein